MWSDGGTTEVKTTTWAVGEPNNVGTERCGNIVKVREKKLALNDLFCSRKNTYICEI